MYLLTLWDPVAKILTQNSEVYLRPRGDATATVVDVQLVGVTYLLKMEVNYEDMGVALFCVCLKAQWQRYCHIQLSFEAQWQPHRHICCKLDFFEHILDPSIGESM